MTPRSGVRAGATIGLIFALVWLGVGVSVLSGAAKFIVGLVGVTALVAAGLRAWRRPAISGRGFDRRWYWGAVAAELAAMLLFGALFDIGSTPGAAWPVIGVIVGLHFIGLWKAVDDRRFLWLAGCMTAINLVALAAGPNMQLVSGLGSSAAIALAIGA